MKNVKVRIRGVVSWKIDHIDQDNIPFKNWIKMYLWKDNPWEINIKVIFIYIFRMNKEELQNWRNFPPAQMWNIGLIILNRAIKSHNQIFFPSDADDLLTMYNFLYPVRMTTDNHPHHSLIIFLSNLVTPCTYIHGITCKYFPQQA